MTGPSETAPDLQAVVAAARTTTGRSGGPRHSPLYEWLWARYSDMAVELNPPRTPNWAALADQFGALGVFDGKGGPPLAVTVRQTWGKVRQQKQAVAAGEVKARKPRGKVPASQTATPEAAAQPAPPQRYPADVQPVDDDAPVRPTFRLSGGIKKRPLPNAEQE